MTHANPLPNHGYRLFRYGPAPDLLCTVPMNRPVPAFLDGEAWTCTGTIRDGDAPLPGFIPAEANHGIRLNGFYLFQQASPASARASSD